MPTVHVNSWFDDYTEFANACGKPIITLLDPPNWEAINLGVKLVREEWEVETKEALARYSSNPSLENLAEVADGIGDSIYVLCELARSLGLPLNSVWDRIQAANMAKVDPDTGLVNKRADGKILKPEGWTPPDIFECLIRHSNMQAVQQEKLGAENWTNGKEWRSAALADVNKENGT